jgi:hypothetical protein
MKVKRLRDGKIVEVEKHGDAMIDENGKVMYFDEVCEVDEPDWQHYRIQAAIAAMQGMIANPQTFEQLDHDKGYREIRGGDKSQIVAIASVMYADALIKELKKGGQE